MENKKPYYSQAQNKATQKYQAENLEQVRFWVRKGERAIIQEEAELQGMSLAQYMIQAVNSHAGRELITPSDGKKKTETE